MNCPKCLCDRNIKSVFIKGLQRYKYKGYGCNYTVDKVNG